jgi:hypothetical protein
MSALRVRSASSLGAVYRTQISQLYGVLVYHAPELGFLAPARGDTPRARTAMAQGQLDRQEHGYAYRSYPCEWLLADPDRMPCIHDACEYHSVPAKPMTVASVTHSTRVPI